MQEYIAVMLVTRFFQQRVARRNAVSAPLTRRR